MPPYSQHGSFSYFRTFLLWLFRTLSFWRDRRLLKTDYWEEGPKEKGCCMIKLGMPIVWVKKRKPVVEHLVRSDFQIDFSMMQYLSFQAVFI